MSYQLRTDALGRKRLNIQGKLYNPSSHNFLLSQGIKKGQSILEVGCGSGTMTTWLAEQVGRKGRVLAIDNSALQVSATQRQLNKLRLKQVECRELSVFDLDLLKEKFDIIYCRCVLIHLTNPDTALTQMHQRLKKNGLIVIEEILNSCNFCHPESPVFKKRRHTIEQFFIKNGLNPNFALELKAKLKKHKFSSTHESLFQPILNDTDKRKLLSLFLVENKEKIISLKILTFEEWQQLVNELKEMEKDKSFFVALSSLYQVSAKK